MDRQHAPAHRSRGRHRLRRLPVRPRREREVDTAKGVVNAARNLRSELKIQSQYSVPPSFYITGTPSSATTSAFSALVRQSDLKMVEELPDSESPVAVLGQHRLMLHVEM